MKKCAVCKASGLLAGLGALNWGLYGIFNVDLVSKLLGEMTMAAKVAYGLVGVAGLLALASIFNLCPCTKEGSSCK